MSHFTNIEHNRKIVVLLTNVKPLIYAECTYNYIVKNYDMYNPYVPRCYRVKLLRRNGLNNKTITSNFFIAN